MAFDLPDDFETPEGWDLWDFRDIFRGPRK